MKKISILTLVALFFATGFYSCQPYEDGPKISFRSKEERAVNTWKVEYAFEDEKDISKRYEDISMKLDYEGLLEVYTALDSDSVAIQKGFWEFYNDQENLRFNYTVPAVYPDRDHYKILRLSEKEMWLWDIEDSLGLEIRLAPVE